MNKDKNKKRLGRGLESLLKVNTSVVDEKPVKASPAKINLKSPKVEIDEKKLIHQVPVEQLRPNEDQPRKVFDQNALKDLAASIKEQGVMQPIVAKRLSKTKFEIIAGERRWRASQACGLKTVPVILKEVNDQAKLELAIIENIQRDNLNPIEEGEAYKQLADKYKLTQKEIAIKVGKERATVANLMRVTQLGDKVKSLVIEGLISLGHAKVLLSVESPKKQLDLAEKIHRLNLSVRAAESMVKNTLNPEREEADKKQASSYKSIEDSLRKTFGTKVKIHEKNGKGKLELNFHSVRQFNEIIDKLMNI